MRYCYKDPKRKQKLIDTERLILLQLFQFLKSLVKAIILSSLEKSFCKSRWHRCSKPDISRRYKSGSFLACMSLEWSYWRYKNTPIVLLILRYASFKFSLGGTVGAIVTCPLEVVKTRLQSSVSHFHIPPEPPTLFQRLCTKLGARDAHPGVNPQGPAPHATSASGTNIGLWRCLR